jgi:hypothetical protein
VAHQILLVLATYSNSWYLRITYGSGKVFELPKSEAPRASPPSAVTLLRTSSAIAYGVERGRTRLESL